MFGIYRLSFSDAKGDNVYVKTLSPEMFLYKDNDDYWIVSQASVFNQEFVAFLLVITVY